MLRRRRRGQVEYAGAGVVHSQLNISFQSRAVSVIVIFGLLNVNRSSCVGFIASVFVTHLMATGLQRGG